MCSVEVSGFPLRVALGFRGFKFMQRFRGPEAFLKSKLAFPSHLEDRCRN